MARWIPSRVADTDLVNKSFKGLLSVAKRKLDQKVLKLFGDTHGVFAFETEDFVVVAKDYIYGWVISAHEQIIKYALNTKKPLLMFINENSKFYKFSPSEILKEGTKNRRGDSTFINFDIKLGTALGKRLIDNYPEEKYKQKSLSEFK